MSGARPFNLHTVMFFWVAPFLAAAAGICAFLTYSRVHEAIITGFDGKLIAAASTSSVFIKGEDHHKLMQLGSEPDPISGKRAEDTDLYKAYSLPMQRIMRDGRLTYHYTIVLKDGVNIKYGVDATEGADHSFLGTEEENPPEESERLRRALKTGIVSISPIQQFDIWGKLKIANAPVLGRDGKAAALVGADVNISAIDKKTRVAFLQVLGAGLLSLLFAGLMTWFVARRLALPLRRLKEAALHIGGGDFDRETGAIDQPELRRVGEALETLGRRLEKAPLCILRSTTILQISEQKDADGEALPEAGHALNERMAAIRNCGLFRSLSRYELSIVAQASTAVRYRPGALICAKNSIPSYVFLVQDGSLSGDPASPVAGLAGWESVLFEKPLTEDLRASADTGAKCVLIQKEHVFTMLHECPGILTDVIEHQLEGAPC